MKMSPLKLTTKVASSLILTLMIVGLTSVAFAQDEQPRPVTYTTAPKLVIAKIRGQQRGHLRCSR